MGYLIDTSVLIDIERRNISASQFITELNDQAAIASITASELLMGLHRAVAEQQRQRRQQFIETVLAQTEVASFDLK